MRPLLLAAALAAGCTVPATGPSGDGPEGGADGAPDGGSADDGGEPEPGDGFLRGFFPIAADYQPHGDFENWLGLKMIRQPRGDPARDIDEAGLLAWHWMDEPELHHGHPPG